MLHFTDYWFLGRLFVLSISLFLSKSLLHCSFKTFWLRSHIKSLHTVVTSINSTFISFYAFCMIVETLNSTCSNSHVNIIWKIVLLKIIKVNSYLCSFDLVTSKTAVNMKISRTFLIFDRLTFLKHNPEIPILCNKK